MTLILTLIEVGAFETVPNDMERDWGNLIEIILATALLR